MTLPTDHNLSSTGIVNDLLDAWNSHDADRIVELYASEYEGVDVADPDPQHGQAGARRSLARYLDAFPDLQFQREEVLQQGDRVVVHWIAKGTHLGPLMHIPPTGRSIEVRGVSFLTIQGNKVYNGLYIWDVAGLLRSFGLLPDL